MTGKKIAAVLLCLFFLTSVCTPCLAAEKPLPASIRFLSGPPGGSWFALGNALAGLWRDAGIPASSVTGGAVSNLSSVNAARADLCFTVTSMLGAAAKGAGDLPAMDNVALMGSLYSQYTYFVARKDFIAKHKIFLLSDLFEHKVPVRLATLRPGTGSEFMVRTLFEKAYNATYKTIEKNGGSVQFASYEGGADMLAEGRIDIFAFSVGLHSAVLQQIAQRADVEIMEIDSSALRALSRAYGTQTFLLKPDARKGVAIPTRTVGDYTCIVVRKDLPDDLVYKLCKTIWRNNKELAALMPDMGELNPKTAMPPQFPLHPGAEKFWSEVR